MKVGLQSYNFISGKNIKTRTFKKTVTPVLNNDIAEFTKNTKVKKTSGRTSYIGALLFLAKIAVTLLATIFIFKISDKFKK